MKRKILCLISVMMILVLAAGCGKSDGTSGGSPTRTETTGTETAAPEAGGTGTEDTAGMTGTAASRTATETTAPAPGGNTESGSAPGNNGTGSGSRISEDEAKEIALKDAGVSENDISGMRIKLEKDDGIWQYEVDFYADDKEYDYDIEADTGKILSKDMEIDDDFRKSGALK